MLIRRIKPGFVLKLRFQRLIFVASIPAVASTVVVVVSSHCKQE